MLNEAVVAAQATGDGRGEAEARGALAHVYASTGRLAMAIAERRRVCALLRELGQVGELADERVSLAELLHGTGDTDAARAELEAAVAEARSVGAEQLAARAAELLDALP